MNLQEDISTSGRIETPKLTISDNFTNHSEISSGGYSRLCKAQRYGQWFVLKGLKPDFVANPLYVEMLTKEFNLTIKLHHPNIVRSFGHENDVLIGECIVLEYVDGCTLRDFLKDNPPKSVRKQIVNELLDAMRYFHRKLVVHQDLKPSNILITADGNHVKIIDFGLSDSSQYAVLKGAACTKMYASPEQLAGEPADNRSDFYAFGIILREIFPKRYRNVVKKCTHPNRQFRYGSEEEILKAFRHYYVSRISMAAMSIVFILGCALTFALHSDDHPESPKRQPFQVMETSTPEKKVVGNQLSYPAETTILHFPEKSTPEGFNVVEMLPMASGSETGDQAETETEGTATTPLTFSAAQKLCIKEIDSLYRILNGKVANKSIVYSEQYGNQSDITSCQAFIALEKYRQPFSKEQRIAMELAVLPVIQRAHHWTRMDFPDIIIEYRHGNVSQQEYERFLKEDEEEKKLIEKYTAELKKLQGEK